MRNGLSSRVWLAIAATTVTAAMAFAPSALAGTAGTSAWRVQNATDSGAYSASRMSVTLALAERNQSALDALIARPHAAAQSGSVRAQFAPSTAHRRRDPQLGGRQQPHAFPPFRPTDSW